MGTKNLRVKPGLNKLRPMGAITQDLELLLEEMTAEHGLQWGEVLGLVHTWLSVHAPDEQEEYTSGGNPIYFYGYKK